MLVLHSNSTKPTQHFFGGKAKRQFARRWNRTKYTYNAASERVKKSSASETIYFAYDDQGHLIGEYDTTGILIQETVWLDDFPVATIRLGPSSQPEVYYVHTDHLRTPRLATRPSDNVVVWRWDSTPYGFSAADNNPDGDSVEFKYNLRFPGQYFDEESGLHYNYFRTYDPTVGRYVESDPIGLRGGHNTYAFTYGNPISRIDPRGLQSVAGCLNPANVLACAAAGEISEATAAAVSAAARRSAARAAAILLAYAAGREICKDLEEDCTEEIEACSELCAEAQTDPDRKLFYGGSMAQCMRNCLPERCGGEPLWKGFK